MNWPYSQTVTFTFLFLSFLLSAFIVLDKKNPRNFIDYFFKTNTSLAPIYNNKILYFVIIFSSVCISFVVLDVILDLLGVTSVRHLPFNSI